MSNEYVQVSIKKKQPRLIVQTYQEELPRVNAFSEAMVLAEPIAVSTPMFEDFAPIDGCRCGGHSACRASLYDSISIYPENRCVQLFLGPPTTFNSRDISSSDKIRTLDYCNRTDTTFYVHCPYVANL